MRGNHTNRRQFLRETASVSTAAIVAGCSSVPFLGDDDSRPRISYGETVEGEITDDGPTDPNRKGLATPYVFKGTEGESPVITMTAEAFEPFVLITNPQNHLVAAEDEGTQTESWMETDLLQDGQHTVWAGSESKSATSAFRLSLARKDG